MSAHAHPIQRPGYKRLGKWEMTKSVANTTPTRARMGMTMSMSRIGCVIVGWLVVMGSLKDAEREQHRDYLAQSDH